MVASVLTFFGWPYYCQTQANHYIDNVIGKENLQDNGSIGRDTFLHVWERDPSFRQTIRDSLPKVHKDGTHSGEAMAYFSHIDDDNSGDIDRQELQKLVQARFYNGWETYLLDTFGTCVLKVHF